MVVVVVVVVLMNRPQFGTSLTAAAVADQPEIIIVKKFTCFSGLHTAA